MSQADAPHAPPPTLAGPALIISGLLLAVANFMVVLDTTIANVSVPNIAGGLAVSPSQGTWVITSYAVAEAITVPLTGWLAQRFGPVRVFAIAMMSFGIWSALCGLSPSLGVLVVCRVFQGLSGGPMIPLSQTLLLRIFPKERAGAAIGLWSMTTVVAPIAGPVLGGTICDSLGWPWVFYINVPVALVCALLVWRALRAQEPAIVKRPVDLVGLGLLVVWVSALQVLLDKGKELDWFASPVIAGLGIVAATGFICFVIWELTDENPIVDLRVFRHRGFTVGAITLALGFGAFFSSVVLIPLWLQTNLLYTATSAGYAMAFNGALAVVFSPIVARIMTRVDPRALVSFGLLLMGVLSLVRTGFASNIDFWGVSWPNLAQGLAIPFFFVPLTGLALSAVRPEETASAAGLANFMRTTAGAFGTSVITTQWDSAGTHAKTALVGRVAGSELLGQLGAQGMSPGQASGQLDLLVNSQATMVATDQMFAAVAGVFLLGGLAIWMAPRPKGPIAAASH